MGFLLLYRFRRGMSLPTVTYAWASNELAACLESVVMRPSVAMPQQMQGSTHACRIAAKRRQTLALSWLGAAKLRRGLHQKSLIETGCAAPQRGVPCQPPLLQM